MAAGSGELELGRRADRPFLSIVVTAYRRRQFLLEAVRSIAAGSADPSSYEVVVVKDFSDPEVDAELMRIGPRVRLITEDFPRVGGSLARGVREAQGDVIAFLDDDDRFAPEKVATVLQQFRNSPGLGFFRHAYRAIDAEGAPVPSWEEFRPVPPASRSFLPHADPADGVAWIFRFSPHVNVSTMAIRTELLRPWLEAMSTILTSQDCFLFVTALVSGSEVRVVRDRLSDYRVHPSVSHAAIAAGTEDLDLRDTARSLATAEVISGIAAGRPGHPLAVRFARAFLLEVRTNVFLLDPTARLAVRDWLGLARSAVARRQKYLLVPWLFCLYRWCAPRRAAASYQRRRARRLRTAASAGP